MTLHVKARLPMDTPDYLTSLGSASAVKSSAHRAVILADHLPRNPFESVKEAKIPAPPLLTTDMPMPQCALIVARTYLGALKAKGVKPIAFQAYMRRDRTPDITKMQQYDYVCGLVRLFQEHEIPPAPWATFRLSVLMHKQMAAIAAGKEPPPFKAPALGALFAPEWLHEPPRRGWFRKEYGAQQWGGKVINTPARTALMEAWSGLQDDLDATPELTPEVVRSLVVQRFPGDLLQTLIRRANEEAIGAQAHYDNLVKQGEWLW